jgi:glycosyltransferase involved in cell wall biosynthesis
VDNASTDNTAEVVKAARLLNMPVRYTLERQRGQSQARNTGIAAARGEIILFTDDDVRPSQDWIAGMCGPILSGEADAVAGGVMIAPHLRRDWMTQEHQNWVASTGSIAQEKRARMVGANMAFSCRVLEKVPQFDTDLGPGALGFSDDTLFTFQLVQAGFLLKFALDVCVEHHFDPSRLGRQNFVSSAQKMGSSWAYIAHHWLQDEPPVTWRRIVNAVLRLLLWRAGNLKHYSKPEGMAEAEMLLLQRLSSAPVIG